MGSCFCGSVDFLIYLNASVPGNPDKGDGDFEDGEGVKEDVRMRFTSGCAEYVLLIAVSEERESVGPCR